MDSSNFVSNSSSEHGNLLQAILDNAGEGTVLIGKDHNVLLFNTVMQDFLKRYFTRELKVGDDYRDFVVEGNMELYLDSFEKAINGTAISIENETKDEGVSIWFLYKMNPVYSTQRELIGVTLTAINITDRKGLEFEREGIIDDLLQRNRDLVEFSQIVSHSIRGPLATLLGLINLFTHDLPEKEIHFVIDGIKKSSERLDGVISDLNRVLQIKESVSETRTEIDLNHLLDDIRKRILNENKNAVVIKSDFKSMYKLNSTRTYLSDIFYNLISNSIKYAKPDVPPVIEIWTEKMNGFILIYFKDNGIGIDVNRHKDRIFGLYQRFDSRTQGRGLGLFLTKTEVDKLNGKIEVESDIDLGTTFKVILPQ